MINYIEKMDNKKGWLKITILFYLKKGLHNVQVGEWYITTIKKDNVYNISVIKGTYINIHFTG
jgi:hypothetical protein